MLKPISLSLCILAVTAFTRLVLITSTFAQTNAPKVPDYTQIGHNIIVGPGQQVSDVTCVACSIHIRGQVSGDAVAVGGSIFVEDGAQVSGDVTVVAGSVRLENQVKVAGDTIVVGGEVHRASGAQIGGDVTNVGGTFLAIFILVSPVLFLGLIVALIIWLVQRSRRPVAPAAAV
jgi:hypothetical protein